MEEKKKSHEVEKKISEEQAALWKQENEEYFKREKEINELVYFNNKDLQSK